MKKKVGKKARKKAESLPLRRDKYISCPYPTQCKDVSFVRYRDGFICAGIRKRRIKDVPSCDKLVVCVHCRDETTSLFFRYDEALGIVVCLTNALANITYKNTSVIHK